MRLQKAIFLGLLVAMSGRIPAYSSARFQAVTNYPSGTSPSGVAAGDFNGDGNLDLAVVNAGNSAVGDNGSVSILLGKGDGTFKAATNFNACVNCTQIAAGDFNGDGNADLAVVRPGDVNTGDDGDVTVFLSNGDGTFHKGQLLTPGKNPSCVVVLDVNADHHPDLAVSNLTDNTVAVLFGNGDGTFKPPVPYPVGQSPVSITLVDFNRDGLIDLAVRRFAHADLLLANGDGTFRSGPSFYFGLSNTVSWADFNGDGNVDFLTYGCGLFTHACSYTLHLGTGNGTFQTIQSVSLGISPGVLVADYDGDSKLDIAGVVQQGQVGVASGNGDGTFQQALALSIDPTATVALGSTVDLNGDGAPDLVTLNSNGAVGVLLNSGTDFSISASAFSPAKIAAGQSASSTLTLSLLNSFNNPVALSCSVQPADAGAPTCSINPSSSTFDSAGHATAQLTVTAGALASSGQAPLGRDFLNLLALAFLPIGGLSLIRTRAYAKRVLAQRALTAVFTMAISIVLLLSASCGGGGATTTQARNYSVTVTAKSASSQHSTNLTLLVQ